MRVRMLHGFSGGIQLIPGDIADFPDHEAVRLIDAGFAVPHGERQVETPEKPRAAIEQRAAAKPRVKRRAKASAKKKK